MCTSELVNISSDKINQIQVLKQMKTNTVKYVQSLLKMGPSNSEVVVLQGHEVLRCNIVSALTQAIDRGIHDGVEFHSSTDNVDIVWGVADNVYAEIGLDYASEPWNAYIDIYVHGFKKLDRSRCYVKTDLRDGFQILARVEWTPYKSYWASQAVTECDTDFTETNINSEFLANYQQLVQVLMDRHIISMDCPFD